MALGGFSANASTIKKGTPTGVPFFVVLDSEFH